MGQRKFTLYKDVKIGRGWQKAKAAFYSNGKIKPNIIVYKGKEQEHPEGGYYANDRGKWVFAGTVGDVVREIEPAIGKVKEPRGASVKNPSKIDATAGGNDHARRFRLPDLKEGGERRVTIWFNAWKYESTAQVWAGLADCIIKQIGDRLGPVERELFWFHLQLRRVDIGKVRRRIYEEVVALFVEKILPWLWAYLAGPVLALLVAIVSRMLDWSGGQTLGSVGFVVTCLVDLAVASTKLKEARSEVEKNPARVTLGEFVEAPDYRANLGFIHEVVEDLKRVFRVIPAKYLPMVIFIDDLDRCSPGKVADVVEALNLFLAGEFPDCMFVLGIDDEMVAAALDKAHSEVIAKLPAYARSTSIGWRFMDKFVQLSDAYQFLLQLWLSHRSAENPSRFATTLTPSKLADLDNHEGHVVGEGTMPPRSYAVENCPPHFWK